MNSTKIWLIIATIFVITGIITFVVAMTVNNWNFSGLDTNKYTTNTYEINEDFNSISLQTSEASITFLPSDNDTCKVTCYEAEAAKHDVIVKDNSLTININDQRKWYNYIGLTLSSPSITVYLPKSEYASLNVKCSTGKTSVPSDFNFDSADIYVSTGDVNFYASVLNDLKIRTSTGAVCVEDMTADMLELSTTTGNISITSVKCHNDIKLKVSTGRTTVKNVRCNNFTSDGDTGLISLDNLISDEKAQIKRTTGNIKFNQCDASEIYAKTSTGNISGSLLSDKIFITETSTGTVKVPKTTTGGKCELITSTGNIKIELTATEG